MTSATPSRSASRALDTQSSLIRLAATVRAIGVFCSGPRRHRRQRPACLHAASGRFASERPRTLPSTDRRARDAPLVPRRGLDKYPQLPTGGTEPCDSPRAASCGDLLEDSAACGPQGGPYPAPDDCTQALACDRLLAQLRRASPGSKENKPSAETNGAPMWIAARSDPDIGVV